MNRKDFLMKAGLYGTGLLLAPHLLSFCATGLNIDHQFKGKVLIIGAGMAGMSAARVLWNNGVDITVLEASPQAGGRLKKISGIASYDIDLGAEWLHGTKSELAHIIKTHGHTYFKDNSELTFWFNNELKKELPQDVFSPFDKPNLPDISFFDYAQQNGWEEYSYIIQANAGSNGADIRHLSAYWNVKEFENWSSGNTDYKFNRTWYDFFVSYFEETIKTHVITNMPVQEINYTGENIIVKAANKKYSAHKVIITVPISILKDGDIIFSPALPAKKTEAFSKIGMDHGMKVYLKFDHTFYDQNIIGGKICSSYMDESYGRNSNYHVLLAFIIGSQAEHLSSLDSELQIFNALIAELDEMYDGLASKHFISGIVQDWSKEPYIRGAYSYSSIGIGEARQTAAQTIDNKLYFAGEAMNVKGHFQSVHGAYETGIAKALEILKEYAS